MIFDHGACSLQEFSLELTDKSSSNMSFIIKMHCVLHCIPEDMAAC